MMTPLQHQCQQMEEAIQRLADRMARDQDDAVSSDLSTLQSGIRFMSGRLQSLEDAMLKVVFNLLSKPGVGEQFDVDELDDCLTQRQTEHEMIRSLIPPAPASSSSSSSPEPVPPPIPVVVEEIQMSDGEDDEDERFEREIDRLLDDLDGDPASSVDVSDTNRSVFDERLPSKGPGSAFEGHRFPYDISATGVSGFLNEDRKRLATQARLWTVKRIQSMTPDERRRLAADARAQNQSADGLTLASEIDRMIQLLRPSDFYLPRTVGRTTVFLGGLDPLESGQATADLPPDIVPDVSTRATGMPPKPTGFRSASSTTKGAKRVRR